MSIIESEARFLLSRRLPASNEGEQEMSGTAARIAEVTGRTRVLVLVGDPMHAAKSPQLFNPLFVTQGRDAICIPMQVPADGFDAFVTGMRQVANLDGTSRNPGE
jgi:shikimate dehydrogenase